MSCEIEEMRKIEANGGGHSSELKLYAFHTTVLTLTS